MISVFREENTHYLFPGFLDRELKKYPFDRDITIAMEPKRGDIYFSQDYLISNKDYPFQFVFYALPSLKKDMELMMGKNCALVTYAADPDFHAPQKVEKLYDVGFIGKRYYVDRNKYLETITKFWPRSFLNLQDCPNALVPQYLNQCKVLFNHTRPEIDVNLRFFEAMALGCQVMLRTPALDQFAQDGVHYMGYSSHEEAVEIIQRLLADDDLRMKIAHNAREHFLKHHTYAHRAKEIVKRLTDYFERNP